MEDQHRRIIGGIPEIGNIFFPNPGWQTKLYEKKAEMPALQQDERGPQAESVAAREKWPE
jgi:hypothetical protein